jgi:hypothetical protein
MIRSKTYPHSRLSLISVLMRVVSVGCPDQMIAMAFTSWFLSGRNVSSTSPLLRVKYCVGERAKTSDFGSGGTDIQNFSSSRKKSHDA